MAVSNEIIAEENVKVAYQDGYVLLKRSEYRDLKEAEFFGDDKTIEELCAMALTRGGWQ